MDGTTIRVAGLAAFGYALLEVAFFAHRNQLLPWESAHLSLAALFFLLHLAVALLVALPASVLLRKLAPTFVPFVPVATLIAVHSVTFFRERYYALPRDLGGTLGTVGLALLPFAVAAIPAFVLRRRPAAAGVAALIAAFALVVWGGARVGSVRPMGHADASEPRPASDRVTATDTGQRVLLFGFDGATWAQFDPLIAQGRLPNLAALAARGRTLELETIRPTFSPVIWSSVATGKDRFAHGIHDVVQTTLPGGTVLHRSIARTAFFTKTTGVLFRALNDRRMLRLTPYRSRQVRVASVFELASEAGLSTSRIEWYVTWPAASLNGVNVSDRFHLQREDGPEIEGVVSPEALRGPLAVHVVTQDDIPLEQVMTFVDTEGLDAAAADAWAARYPKFVREMQLNIARDLTTRNVTVDLLSRDPDWRLFGVYFRSVDLAHHLSWETRRRGGDPEQRPELRKAVAIDRYYEFMDGIVGDVLAEVPEDAVVLLLSDHGFEDKFAHARAPDGVAILAGGPVTPSAERERIGVYDIAPTVAQLLGLPVAADLSGRARTDLLDPDFVRANPERPISTWERVGRLDDARTAAEDRDVEDSEIERLRALGYLR